MFHPEYIARQNVARVVLKLFIAMTMKMMLLQGSEKMKLARVLYPLF